MVKNMKKLFAILLSLVLAVAIPAITVYAADSNVIVEPGDTTATDSSFGSMFAGIGETLNKMITDLGGETDFDFSPLFNAFGSVADLDLGKYMEDFTLSNFFNGMGEVAAGFMDTENINLGGTLSLFNDMGFGDLGGLFGSEGLGGLIGINAGTGEATTDEDGNATEGSDAASAGLTGIFSSFAGTIADMTSNIDILDMIGGLISGQGSGSNTTETTTGSNTLPTGNTVLPTGSNSSSNNGNSNGNTYIPVPTANNADETPVYTTQEYTTRNVILYEIQQDQSLPGGTENDTKSKGAVAGGIILVLASFGAIAYLVVKKVL